MNCLRQRIEFKVYATFSQLNLSKIFCQFFRNWSFSVDFIARSLPQPLLYFDIWRHL